ncbi:triose-phosphate isomerase, partial [Pelagibacteraceae bacterium]|nr:triose-phosphate isomerase [Pelagibacteraceae bacterium]
SAEMLKEKNTNFCLVGHSERRQYFNENNENVRIKSTNLINKNIIPVICIGETLEEKEKKITKSILSKQLEEGLPEISNYQNTLIAYEPIWAIGTGLTPSLEDIQEVHQHIKQIDKKLNNFQVLYGGSVKSTNSRDINALENVDGCLIGGSSLKVDEFNTIIT